MRKGPDVNDDLHSKDVRQARVITVPGFVRAIAAQRPRMLAVTIPTRHLFSLASVVCCVHCPAESESDPFQIQLIAR